MESECRGPHLFEVWELSAISRPLSGRGGREHAVKPAPVNQAHSSFAESSSMWCFRNIPAGRNNYGFSLRGVS